MKKTLLLLAMVTLVACNNPSETQSKEKEGFTKLDEDLTITIDTTTGCKFLVYNGGNKGGVIQMLDSTGKPDCEVQR